MITLIWRDIHGISVTIKITSHEKNITIGTENVFI